VNEYVNTKGYSYRVLHACDHKALQYFITR